MRKASDADNFPYTRSTMCYFEVGKNGDVKQVPHKNKGDRPGVLEAYGRATQQEVTLYAVWPGNWSSDLFIIDDLEAFGKVFELL